MLESLETQGSIHKSLRNHITKILFIFLAAPDLGLYFVYATIDDCYVYTAAEST